MKIFTTLLVLALTISCSRNDKFLQRSYEFDKTRFQKTYKFDTTSSESYAVDVDILWVIDNSGSMGPYQRAVANNSAAFISQFTAASRLHWRMGLISTDNSQQPYMGFSSVVDWQTANATGMFTTAVGRLGTSGDSWAEQTFGPTIRVLNAYPGWLRTNAYLIVIAVSDELEQSSISTQQFMADIQRKVGGDISRFVVYGVYGPDSNKSYNDKYDEIVRLTGGKSYSLDSPDYGILLADLGKDLVKKTTVVDPIVLLDQRPIADTIIVKYKGRILIPGKEWTYNSQYNYISVRDPKILDTSKLDVDVSFEIDDQYAAKKP